MGLTESDIRELKETLFEVYSAGFEAGYTQENNIVESYNKYWEYLMELGRKVKNEWSC